MCVTRVRVRVQQDQDSSPTSVPGPESPSLADACINVGYQDSYDFKWIILSFWVRCSVHCSRDLNLISIVQKATFRTHTLSNFMKHHPAWYGTTYWSFLLSTSEKPQENIKIAVTSHATKQRQCNNANGLRTKCEFLHDDIWNVNSWARSSLNCNLERQTVALEEAKSRDHTSQYYENECVGTGGSSIYIRWSRSLQTPVK